MLFVKMMDLITSINSPIDTTELFRYCSNIRCGTVGTLAASLKSERLSQQRMYCC